MLAVVFTPEAEVTQVLEKALLSFLSSKCIVDHLCQDSPFFCKSQANSEKLCGLYERRLNEANTKLDEVTQLANDLTAQRTKLQSESGE